MKRPIRHLRSHFHSAGRRHGWSGANPGASDSGVSLIEVMIAFVVLMVAMVPLGYLMSSVLASSAQTQQQVEGLQLAERWLDVVSNSNPPTVTVGGETYVPLGTSQTPTDPAGYLTASPTINGTHFHTRVSYTEQAVSSGANTDQCTSATSLSAARPGVVTAQITVKWGRTGLVTDTTNINYPKPGVQSDGFVSVQVSGDTAATDAIGNTWSTRVQTIPIVLTPYTSATTYGTPLAAIYPNADGCAFSQVPIPSYQGDYLVTVGQPVPNTPSGSTVGSTSTPLFTDTGGAVFATGDTTNTYTYGTVAVSVTQQTNVAVTFDEGTNVAFTYPASTAVADGVICPGASSVSCIATGSGTAGASMSWFNGTNWSAASSSTATRIASVACTSGGQTCVGGGYSSSGGLIITRSTAGGAATVATLPTGATITGISHVVCPSASGCYAIGTQTVAGNPAPVLLAGNVSTATPGWDIVSPPTGVTFVSLTAIACPSTTVCEVAGAGKSGTTTTLGILRLDGDPATVGTTPGWQPSITNDVLPSTTGSTPSHLSAISQVVCVSPTSCLALGTGDTTNATEPSVLAATISITPLIGTTWTFDNLHLPTGTTNQLTGLSCSGTTGAICVAVGSQNATTPLVETATLAPDTWAVVATASLPTGIGTVTGVSCPSTTKCLLSADVPGAPTGSSSAMLIAGTDTSGTWAWAQPTLPSSDTMSFFAGVACQAGGTICAAVGATPTGPVMLTSSGGPGGSWSDTTQAGLTGLVPPYVPIATSITQSSGYSTIVPFGTSDATAPNPVYPQSGGYYVAAADCTTEAANAPIQSFSTSPGNVVTTMVPLGVAPIEVTTAAGAPAGGASVSLVAHTTGCPADAYTLATTGPDGLTRVALPYGTYIATVTSGATTVTGTVVVAVDKVSFTPITPTAGPTVTGILPNAVPVAL
jgi:Tfp pilus assembly protein PilV